MGSDPTAPTLLLQVPLEALLGNSSAGMAVLRDVLERERSDLLSGKAPSCGQAEELSFAQALGSDGWSLYPGDEEGKVSDEGETTDVDDMDHVELM